MFSFTARLAAAGRRKRKRHSIGDPFEHETKEFFFSFKTRATLVLGLAMVTVTGLNNFLVYCSNIVSHFEHLRNSLGTIAKTAALSIADSYDAMTSARFYRGKPLSHEEAILEIKRVSGTQFRPEVVDAFLKVMHQPV